MIYYSQHDPAFDRLPLGKTRLTVRGFGCFVVSLATLYQTPPQKILAVPGAFTPSGLLMPSLIAKACDGVYQGVVKTPTGWVIAVTDHYAYLGYPTHFFCMNPQTKQQIQLSGRCTC